MYFNAEAQAQILERLHFAVVDGGYLVLGKAEMLLSQRQHVRRRGPEAAGVPEGAAGPPRRLWTAGTAGNGG